jgi:hypothetical protein
MASAFNSTKRAILRIFEMEAELQQHPQACADLRRDKNGGCSVTGNEYLFILISFLAAQQLASAAAKGAEEGRSWMESLGINDLEDLVWLRAL